MLVVCLTNVNTSLSKQMGKIRSELSSELQELWKVTGIINMPVLSKVSGIPRTTISSVIKKFRKAVVLIIGRGRQRLITVRDENNLSWVLKQGRRQTL